MALTKITSRTIEPGGISGDSLKKEPIMLFNPVIDQNYTIGDNTNGLSAGPITIANGVTVTVGANSEWTIV